jgi:hypothetical protein
VRAFLKEEEEKLPEGTLTETIIMNFVIQPKIKITLSKQKETFCCTGYQRQKRQS